MTAPERIWTASTNGKCHVGFDAPSLNYTNEYVRADLAAIQPAHVQPNLRDEVIARLVDALDNLLEAVTAEDRIGDHALIITGPTVNLKWLIEATDEARAALAAAKAVQP